MLVNTTGSEEAHSRGHAASVGIDAGAVPRYQCATLKGSVTSDHDSGASLFFAGAVAGSASTPADEEEPAEFVWMFSVRTRRDFESPGEVIRLQCFVEHMRTCFLFRVSGTCSPSCKTAEHAYSNKDSTG